VASKTIGVASGPRFSLITRFAVAVEGKRVAAIQARSWITSGHHGRGLNRYKRAKRAATSRCRPTVALTLVDRHRIRDRLNNRVQPRDWRCRHEKLSVCFQTRFVATASAVARPVDYRIVVYVLSSPTVVLLVCSSSSSSVNKMLSVWTWALLCIVTSLSSVYVFLTHFARKRFVHHYNILGNDAE